MKKTLFLLAMIPSVTFAADSIETEVGSVDNFGEYVTQIWSWAAEVIFGVAVLALIIGGILFIMSGGDEQKANVGQQTIKGALVSIGLVLFSAVIQKFLAKPTQGMGRPQISDTSSVITNLINISIGIVGALAALALVISGLKHILSGGDEEKMETAKKGIKMSILGLVVSLSAWGILQFLVQVWV